MRPPLPYTDTEICTTAIAAHRNWLLWLSFHVQNRHNKPGQKKDQLGSYFSVNYKLALAISVLSSTSEMEQDPMVPTNLTPSTMSSSCLLPLENFNQRISLIREVRNAERKENNQRRPNNNNNNIVIRHCQGHLALSQGL